VFTCVACGETVATDVTFDAVIHLFETEGADAWFIRDPAEYLPAGTACPRCGGTLLKPEDDIVDVWWESGVSHTAVLETRPELHRPAELYLEGSDQHRGWFQSSLLTSVGAYDAPPFKGVLTHGFIVDGDGRKMSKSLGNVVSPLDTIATSGADIIRLWVASADYSQDVSVSGEIIDRTSEAYRRIRNTFRFLLSNLADYEPSKAVAWDDMPELDRYALVTLSDFTERATRAYDEWRFHLVYHAVYGYCVTDLSSFYLDVLKDRLYADAADSLSRRSAQTVLAAVLTTLVRLMAPILAFTAEEIWQFTPEAVRGSAPSVHLAGWPSVPEVTDRGGEADALRGAYAVVLEAREVVTKALEEARNEQVVGKSQEARVRLTAPAAVYSALAERGRESLAEILIVPDVALVAGGELGVEISPASGEKCPRCWNYRALGTDPAHAEVCERCGSVLARIDR
jgi:isoleucyl-tRNA synthetase